MNLMLSIKVWVGNWTRTDNSFRANSTLQEVDFHSRDMPVICSPYSMFHLIAPNEENNILVSSICVVSQIVEPVTTHFGMIT